MRSSGGRGGLFERGRRANLLRAATVAVVATACLVLVSGCSPLFSVPNDDPFWVKVSDQTLDFVWCGENTGRYASLQVRIEATGAESSGLSSFVAGGVFDLNRGQRFSIQQPPEGAVREEPDSAVVVDGVSAIFLYTGSSAKNLDGLRVLYDLERADPKSAGFDWLGPSGRWLENRCGTGTSR